MNERLDMFAASAMIGLVTVPGLSDEEIAKRAYDIAEEMIKESERRKNEQEK